MVFDLLLLICTQYMSDPSTQPYTLKRSSFQDYRHSLKVIDWYRMWRPCRERCWQRYFEFIDHYIDFHMFFTLHSGCRFYLYLWSCSFHSLSTSIFRCHLINSVGTSKQIATKTRLYLRLAQQSFFIRMTLISISTCKNGLKLSILKHKCYPSIGHYKNIFAVNWINQQIFKHGISIKFRVKIVFC